MEYQVIYHRCNSFGGGSSNDQTTTTALTLIADDVMKKRKRFEKSVPRFDGILIVHNNNNKINNDNNNNNKTMKDLPLVTLYKLMDDQLEHTEDDDDSDDSENNNDGSDDDNDPIRGTKSIKSSRKQQFKSHHSQKKKSIPPRSNTNYKEGKASTTTTTNDNNTIKSRMVIVFNGKITKYCPAKATSTADAGVNAGSTNQIINNNGYRLDIDDVLFLGNTIQLQITSICTTTTSTTETNKENNIRQVPIENTRGSMVLTTVPQQKQQFRSRVVSCVPLQSKKLSTTVYSMKKLQQLQQHPHQPLTNTILPPDHSNTTSCSNNSSNTNENLPGKTPDHRNNDSYNWNTKQQLKVLQNNDLFTSLNPSLSQQSTTIPTATNKETLSLLNKSKSTSIITVARKKLPVTHNVVSITAQPSSSSSSSTIKISTNKNGSQQQQQQLFVYMSPQLLPASIRNHLRPHQITGIDFLWNTLRTKKGCLLGDEMGLGKTLMTIACIIATHRSHREKQFIVVCPSSLVVNWANEFDKWLGAASQPKRVAIREGGAEGLQQIRAYTQKTNQQVQHQPGQVLIISYELLRRHINVFSFKDSISIGILVMDEGHRLKNANDSQTFTALESLPTDARLCITATPIQNNLCEFFNLANFCCPGILGPNISDFRKNYERPIAAANQKNATRQDLVLGSIKSKELEQIASTFMIRRLQRDILKTMLPPRTEVLLFCRPTNIQCQQYRSVCRNTCLGNIADALTTLITLRKICAHPCLYQRSEERTTINSPDNIQFSSSGKMFVLDALLTQIRIDAPDDKVVIVSNFTSVLSLIESLILQPRSYSYLRLDGTTKDRQSVVDTFNRTSVDRNYCLLLSSKAGGCGLNIVGANRLIMFDADWNPATCHQAMGRIYRQGQKKPCIIYRLFTSGTLEEVIYQRQLQKDRLATNTVDAHATKQRLHGDSDSSMKFSKEELADCFDLKEGIDCDTKVKLGTNWPEHDQSNLDLLLHKDLSLFAVAKKHPAILCFVHLNNENVSIACVSEVKCDELDTNANQSNHTGYESDCEENEF